MECILASPLLQEIFALQFSWVWNLPLWVKNTFPETCNMNLAHYLRSRRIKLRQEITLLTNIWYIGSLGPFSRVICVGYQSKICFTTFGNIMNKL